MNNKTHGGKRKQLNESESDTMAYVRHSLFADYQDKNAHTYDMLSVSVDVSKHL